MKVGIFLYKYPNMPVSFLCYSEFRHTSKRLSNIVLFRFPHVSYETSNIWVWAAIYRTRVCIANADEEKVVASFSGSPSGNARYVHMHIAHRKNDSFCCSCGSTLRYYGIFTKLAFKYAYFKQCYVEFIHSNLTISEWQLQTALSML